VFEAPGIVHITADIVLQGQFPPGQLGHQLIIALVNGHFKLG
jgi:hypothetical protein